MMRKRELVRRLVRSAAVFAAVAAGFTALCQSPRDPRTTEEFQQLLVRQRGLLARGDSVSRLLASCRDDIRRRGRSDSLDAREVRLEISLFDINNQIGIVAGRLSSMELEWVVNSLDEAVMNGAAAPDSLSLSMAGAIADSLASAKDDGGYIRMLDSLRSGGVAAEAFGSAAAHTEERHDPPAAGEELRKEFGYAGISLRRRGHSAANEVKAIDIYRYPAVYMVRLGRYGELQPPELFRRISPVGYLVAPDGSYVYYAGEFGDETAAFHAAGRLSRMGFGDTRVVLWRRGRIAFSAVQHGGRRAARRTDDTRRRGREPHSAR